jgi:RAQPRD family integrative conjugative element protein
MTLAQPKTTPRWPALALAAALPWLAPASPALADSDGERAALARLAGEIKALEPLLREAERQADAADRVHFNYEAFKDDLEKIMAGVREHLDRPREPKPVPPLAGGYRR